MNRRRRKMSNNNLYPFQLRSPSPEDAGAKTKRQSHCTTHHMIFSQFFSLDEARSYLRNPKGLGICPGCVMFFERMVRNAEAS